MKLYHYTAIYHLQQILKDRLIKTTASNLLEPVNLRIENHNMVSDTDHYKPVVWFSSELDFDSAIKNGLDGSALDKTEVAIEIDTSGPQLFFKWDEWAQQNGIKEAWFERLKRTGPNWRTWYVSENPVRITSTTRIIPRPDMDKYFK